MHIDVWDMNRLNKGLGAVLIFVLTACTSWHEAVSHVEVQPIVFPDYKDVTVPVNVAPLNFEVIDSLERDWALVIETADAVRYMRADNGLFAFGRGLWKTLLQENRGKTMTFTLCFLSDIHLIRNTCSPSVFATEA